MLEIGRQLEATGFVTLDEFAGEVSAERMRRQLLKLHRRGGFGAGGIRGAGGAGAAAAKGKIGAAAGFIRGDEIAWRAVSAGPVELMADRKPLVEHVRLLRENDAAAGGAGGVGGVASRSDAMLTVYPCGGARYVRHTDNSCAGGAGRRCNGRRLTVIGYFNRMDRRELADGALRVFWPGLDSPPRHDFAAQLDRLVLFMADDRVPHSVLPVRKSIHLVCSRGPPPLPLTAHARGGIAGEPDPSSGDDVVL